MIKVLIVYILFWRTIDNFSLHQKLTPQWNILAPHPPEHVLTPKILKIVIIMNCSPSYDQFEVFVNHHKSHISDIFGKNWHWGGFEKFQQELKLPPVGNELTTDHHWLRSLMLIQLCWLYIFWTGDLWTEFCFRHHFIFCHWIISRFKRSLLCRGLKVWDWQDMIY